MPQLFPKGQGGRNRIVSPLLPRGDNRVSEPGNVTSASGDIAGPLLISEPLRVPCSFVRMVVRRLFNTVLKRNRVPAAVPPGQRIYAVGDVHGRLDLLDSVLARIAADNEARPRADTLIVFLGDLVDRGPNSREVVERLLELSQSEIPAKFLLGNHDEIFLKAARGDVKALRYLIRIGGKATVLSYGISEAEYQSADFNELARHFSALVPEAHLQFLASFEDYVEIGDYAFVHAGVRPGIPLDGQASADLRWIRREFLDHKAPHPKVIVHGHSISPDAEIRDNRIGIDTGAFASGRLTAIGLEGSKRWFLQVTGAPDPSWQAQTD